MEFGSSSPSRLYRVALNTAIAWNRKEQRHQRGKQTLEAAQSLLCAISPNGLDPRCEGKPSSTGARQEEAKWRRYLRLENWITYGMSAVLLCGLPFIFLLMVYDDDRRTVLDFMIVLLGIAAALLWAVSLYLSRRMQAPRERRFNSSLRDEIARHLALVDYMMARIWRLASVLLTTLPLFFGVLTLWSSG